MRAIFSKLGMQVVLLVLAAALWWYATDKRTAQVRGLRIPIRVNIPADVILAEQNPRVAHIDVRGPRGMVESAIQRAKRGEIEAVVDLVSGAEGLESGKDFRVVLAAEGVAGMPLQAQITQIVPGHVEVTLAKRVAKRLEVMPRLAGEPAPGFRIVGAPYVQPRYVTVWGPKTVLDKGTKIATNDIDISGVTDEANRGFPWTISINEQLADSNGKPVSVRCRDSVRVYLTVGRIQGRKVIEKVPVRILVSPNSTYAVKLKAEHVDLTVSGPQHLLDKIKPADLEVYVDVTALRPAVAPYRQPVICRLPPELRLEQAAPTVDVDIPLPRPEGEKKP